MGIWLDMHRQDLVESDYHAPAGGGTYSEMTNGFTSHRRSVLLAGHSIHNHYIKYDRRQPKRDREVPPHMF